MHMEKFVNLIVKKLKDDNLFASQGGPIILSQIENEYQHLEVAFNEEGTKYIDWAAKMAIKTDTGVPWIMCKQTKAHGEVIPTCNGRNCGDTWPGPLNKTKPLLWTENWTAQMQSSSSNSSMAQSEEQQQQHGQRSSSSMGRAPPTAGEKPGRSSRTGARAREKEQHGGAREIEEDTCELLVHRIPSQQ